ncbi:MAG TPA: hypothetical protein VGI22_14745 [Xanthobacteraceae bacterium]|jgi:hypothetical protein
MKTPDPARRVTLISESCPGCNFSEAGLPAPYKRDRVLQSQMHNITVRRHADGSGEHACKVEWAAPRDSCKRGHFDRFVQVGNDIILELIKELLAERTSRPVSESRSMAGYQTVNEGAFDLAPEQGPVSVVIGALRHEAPRELKERFVVAPHALDQMRFECRILRGRQREMAGIYRDDNRIDAFRSISSAVDPGRTNAKDPAGA